MGFNILIFHKAQIRVTGAWKWTLHLSSIAFENRNRRLMLFTSFTSKIETTEIASFLLVNNADPNRDQYSSSVF